MVTVTPVAAPPTPLLLGVVKETSVDDRYTMRRRRTYLTVVPTDLRLLHPFHPESVGSAHFANLWNANVSGAGCASTGGNTQKLECEGR
jgi:hypothetical protein